MQSDSGQTIDTAALDIQAIRAQFPILSREVYAQPLVYLDNAATTQKPQRVIDELRDYYTSYNSNVHRGVHYLSQVATDAFENSRRIARDFLGARSTKEIIFTKGATEAINLVANSYVRPRIKPGSEVVITTMEHHSNIVPWQLLREQFGLGIRVVPISDSGELDLDALVSFLGPHTLLVSCVHVSNSLGTINPIDKIVLKAHENGIPVLVDGCQSVQHMPVNVFDLGSDFYVVAGHKLYGPTGTGVLYGRQEILETMVPYQGGGDMIKSVTFDKTIFNDLPYRFEAGTPNIEGVVGLGVAMEWLTELGLDNVARYEASLLSYAHERLQQVDGLRFIGTAANKASLVSFVFDAIHPHDVGTFLDRKGVAVRAGHHCTQPVMQRFSVPATTRASFAVYNTRQEIDVLHDALVKMAKLFG